MSANNKKGKIDVRSWHNAMRDVHGDLTEYDQFMDERRTFYTPEISEYIPTLKSMAKKFNYPINFKKGYSENGDIYVIEWSNNEGQIFELVAGLCLAEDSQEMFVEDSCLFRPLMYFSEFDSILSNDRRKLYSIYWNSNYMFSTEQRFDNMSMSMPSHSSINSINPDVDADYLLKYLGAEDMVFMSDVTYMEEAAMAAKGTTYGECGVQSRWLRFNNSDTTEPHYIRLAYHPSAKAATLHNGVKMDLKQWTEYLADLRADMGSNEYDVFMDDHIGLSIQSATAYTLEGNSTGYNSKKFVAVELEAHGDGEPVLTRREPMPGDPALAVQFGYEKFSQFIRLPASQYPFQLIMSITTMDNLRRYGAPTEFCDWHFCDFSNYRGKDDTLYLDATSCGYEMKDWVSTNKGSLGSRSTDSGSPVSSGAESEPDRRLTSGGVGPGYGAGATGESGR